MLLMVSLDRKSTRLNSSHGYISYAVFCLKKNAGRREPLGDPGAPQHHEPGSAAGHAGTRREPREPRSPARRPLRLLRPLLLFFNDTATTEIYTLSLHDALPI